MAAVADQRFDFVLSDVNLGVGGTGLDLRRALAHACPALPVLLTSGLAREQVEARFGLAPETELLQKPYRPGDLARAMYRVVKGAS